MSDKAHRTNETGQLKPLKDRLDANALARRQEKNEYRRTVSQEHAKTRGALNLLAQACNTEARRQRKVNWFLFILIIDLLILEVIQYLKGL